MSLSHTSKEKAIMYFSGNQTFFARSAFKLIVLHPLGLGSRSTCPAEKPLPWWPKV